MSLEKSNIFNNNNLTITNPRKLTLISPRGCGTERLVSMLTDIKIQKRVSEVLKIFETSDKTVIIGKDIEPTVRFEFGIMPRSYDLFLNVVANAFVNACYKGLNDREKFNEEFTRSMIKKSTYFGGIALKRLLHSEIFNKVETLWLTARNRLPEGVSKKESKTFKYCLGRLIKQEIGHYEEFHDYYLRVNESLEYNIGFLKKDLSLYESLDQGFLANISLLKSAGTKLVFHLPMNSKVQEWYNFKSDLMIDYPSALDHLDDESLINNLLAGIVERTKNPILAVMPLGTNIPLKPLEHLYTEKFDIHTSKSKTLIIFTNVDCLEQDKVEDKISLYMKKYNKIGCYIKPTKYHQQYNPKYLVQKYLSMLDKDFDYSLDVSINEEKLKGVVANFDLTEIDKAIKSCIGKKPSDEDLFNLIENMKLGFNYDSVNNPNEYFDSNDINWTFPTHLYRVLAKNREYLISCMNTNDVHYLDRVIEPRRLTLNFLNILVENFKVYQNSDRLEALLTVASHSIHSELYFYVLTSIKNYSLV